MPTKGRLGLIICLAALLAAQFMGMDRSVPMWMVAIPLTVALIGFIVFLIYPDGGNHD